MFVLDGNYFSYYKFQRNADGNINLMYILSEKGCGIIVYHYLKQIETFFFM